MFKSFAASLLSAAALARGTMDGSSPDNAYVTELIGATDKDSNATVQGIKLTIYTYNSTTQDETTRTKDTYEFHGDTHLETEKPITSAIRYGWCIEATPKVDQADEVPEVPAVEKVDAVEEVLDAEGVVTTAAVEGQEAVAKKDLVPAVVAADPVWDCQVITTDLDKTDVDTSSIPIEETDWYKDFLISDYSYQGLATAWTYAAMTADQFAETKSSDTSWLLSGGKSYKACTATAEAVFKEIPENAKLGFYFKTAEANKQAMYVDCERTEAQEGHSADDTASRFGVNAHWFRNFETIQPDTDMQLMLEDDAAKTRPVFGFFAEYGRSKAREPEDRTYVQNGDEQKLWHWTLGTAQTVTPISAVWKDVQEKALKKEEDDAAAAQAEEDAKNNENNEEETGDEDGAVTNDEGKVEEDGAAQIAAHTTAFIVAVSALAF